MRDIFDEETRQRIFGLIKDAISHPKFGKDISGVPPHFRAQVEAEALNIENCDDDARIFLLALATLFLVDRKKWLEKIDTIELLPKEFLDRLFANYESDEEFDVVGTLEMFRSADPEKWGPVIDWIKSMPEHARTSFISAMKKPIAEQ